MCSSSSEQLSQAPCGGGAQGPGIHLYTYHIRTIHMNKYQSWALALFFTGSLSAQFLPIDRYRSIAHFADFQVRSSLNCP